MFFDDIKGGASEKRIAGCRYGGSIMIEGKTQSQGCHFVRCLQKMALGALLLGFMQAPPATHAQDTPSSSLFGDKVVAKGAGFQIKQNEVDEAVIAYRATAASQGQSVPEAKRGDVEKQVLDRLINVQVLLKRAQEEDRTKAKETSDKIFEQYRSRATSEAAFRRQLIALGTTMDKFRDRIYEECLFKEIIDRLVKPTIVVEEEQVKKYYQDHLSSFDYPERVRAAHVFIMTRDVITQQDLPESEKLAKKQMAETVLKRAKAGEDFAALAKEFSDDPNSRNNGGEIGQTFSRGTLMVPEFDSIVFALGQNQISDLVPTKTGYHIIKLLEKLPARKVPYEEAQKDIRNALTTQETQKQLPEFIKKLRQEDKVEMEGR